MKDQEQKRPLKSASEFVYSCRKSQRMEGRGNINRRATLDMWRGGRTANTMRRKEGEITGLRRERATVWKRVHALIT